MGRRARTRAKRVSPAPAEGAEGRAEDGLTGIPASIHLAATDEGGDPADERQQIVIDAFLDALARVALAVAARAGSAGKENT